MSSRRTQRRPCGPQGGPTAAETRTDVARRGPGADVGRTLWTRFAGMLTSAGTRKHAIIGYGSAARTKNCPKAHSSDVPPSHGSHRTGIPADMAWHLIAACRSARHVIRHGGLGVAAQHRWPQRRRTSSSEFGELKLRAAKQLGSSQRASLAVKARCASLWHKDRCGTEVAVVLWSPALAHRGCVAVNESVLPLRKPRNGESSRARCPDWWAVWRVVHGKYFEYCRCGAARH